MVLSLVVRNELLGGGRGGMVLGAVGVEGVRVDGWG